MAGRAGLKEYLHDSRDLFTSLVLVMPLFVIYQIGILVTGGVRNGVDFVTDALMFALNGNLLYYLGFNVVVLLAFAGAIFALRKRGSFHPRLLPWMLLESAVYALFFGTAVVLMMRSFGMGMLLATGEKQRGVVESIVLSVGAGLYEELVFRLLLMGGLFLLFSRVLRRSKWVSAAIALVVSSFVFSLVHHLGPLGEPFQLGVFMYRFFAGVLLAAIYQLRGFAIAAYTHALYDVYVMVFRGAD